jgi:uncharacterized protein
VLDGFPSTGLVNAIASECLIRSTGTELVSVVDSPEIFLVSIIKDYVPQFPARLYVNEKLRVAFFILELNMGPFMQRTLAEMIFKWTLQNECNMIVSSSGIIMDRKERDINLSEHNSSIERDVRSQVTAITSTDSASKIVEGKGLLV